MNWLEDWQLLTKWSKGALHNPIFSFLVRAKINTDFIEKLVYQGFVYAEFFTHLADSKKIGIIPDDKMQWSFEKLS